MKPVSNAIWVKKYACSFNDNPLSNNFIKISGDHLLLENQTVASFKYLTNVVSSEPEQSLWYLWNVCRTQFGSKNTLAPSTTIVCQTTSSNSQTCPCSRWGSLIWSFICLSHNSQDCCETKLHPVLGSCVFLVWQKFAGAKSAALGSFVIKNAWVKEFL